MIVSKHSNSRFRHWRKRLLSSWQLYTLILPAIISVFIFHYVPIYGVQIAFRDFRSSLGIIGSDWVGLKYFKKFVEYRDFWRIIRNTLSISLYSIATFPCAVVFALMLNEVCNKSLKKTVQMLSYAPHFVSTVVVCSMLTLFLNRSNGLFNNIIELLGGKRIDFLAKPSWFSTYYVWSGVWQNLGWNSIIYLAALTNISPDLHEAAYIDGASKLQIVVHVNLPCIMPTIITMLILRMGSVLSVGFEKIFLLQNPLNLSSSRVISTYVYEVGITNGQFSYSAAIGLFNNIVNIFFIYIVNRVSRAVTKVSLW